MKVLVLTPYLPHRRVGHGGGTAVRDLVRCLAECHEVRVVSLVRPGEETLTAEVEELGAEVTGMPFLDRAAGGRSRATLLAARAGALVRAGASGYPHYVQKYWSADLSRRFLATVEEFSPDAVQVEYLQMSLLARDLWRRRAAEGHGPRVLINSHELGSLPRERRAERAGDPLRRAWAAHEAARWRRLQVDACDWCDRMLCVTPGDRDRFAAMGGHNLVRMPLGMDVRSVPVDRAPSAPDRFLFVGSFAHRPNRLAADFLVRTVWPAVAAEVPDARLILAGRGSKEFLAAVENTVGAPPGGVEAAGFVEDLTPLFRQARLFVAPLPEGGGIKIKILEAMARSIPVVTTPVGAEGIAEQQDGPLYLADCDDTFADAVLRAHRDPERESRAARGRELIEAEFSWEAIVERLTRLYGGHDVPD